MIKLTDAKGKVVGKVEDDAEPVMFDKIVDSKSTDSDQEENTEEEVEDADTAE